MKTVSEEVEGFTRLRIEEDLSKCTSQQREFFGDIYPDGIPRSDLDKAWALVKRTLAENERVAQIRGGCDDPIMRIGDKQQRG